MKEVLGDRRVVLAREITKKFEEFIRGTITEVLSDVENLKGEMVVIVEGNKEVREVISEEELADEIKELSGQGKTNKEIVSLLVKKYNLKKNYVYSLVCEK